MNIGQPVEPKREKHPTRPVLPIVAALVSSAALFEILMQHFAH
jgi:hypothetical protein